MTDLVVDEAPLDRLYRAGPPALSDCELVSLLTGSVATARDVVRDGLPALTRTDWTCRRGISKPRAARLAAAVELARRLAAPPDDAGEAVTDAEHLGRALVGRYSHHAQERLGAVYLDSRNRIIREREIFIGTVNSALVSTRDVLKFALDANAASLVVFHNHPSGDPSPSADDLVFTRKLVEAGKVLGVDVVDHLILGSARFVSLKRRGMI